MIGTRNEDDILFLAEIYEKIDKLLKHKKNKSHLQSELYGVVMYAFNVNKFNDNNFIIDYDELINSFIEEYKKNKVNEKQMSRKESSDYCKIFVLSFLVNNMKHYNFATKHSKCMV
jgi:hypothetical protein